MADEAANFEIDDAKSVVDNLAELEGVLAKNNAPLAKVLGEQLSEMASGSKIDQAAVLNALLGSVENEEIDAKSDDESGLAAA